MQKQTDPNLGYDSSGFLKIIFKFFYICLSLQNLVD